MTSNKKHGVCSGVFAGLKKCYSEYKQFICYCIIVLVVSALALGVSDYHYETFNLISSGMPAPEHYYAIDAFHAIEISILTVFLIFVAWLQLKNLNKTGKSDFLMRIDERFSNPDIIKARTFIHELYILHYPNNCEHSKPPCDKCREQQMQKIRDSIKSIRHEIRLSKSFIRLRHLLELFETMGYLANNEYISLEDMKKLSGGTVEFHYRVFKDWIKFLQENKEEDYFCEFERLVYNINPDLISEDKRNKYSE